MSNQSVYQHIIQFSLYFMYIRGKGKCVENTQTESNNNFKQGLFFYFMP